MSQECAIEETGVRVRQSNRLGQSAVNTSTPFEELSIGQTEFDGRASMLWLIASGLFGAGVFYNLLTRNEDWVANVVIGIALSALLILIWLTGRIRWIGFQPVFVIDRGQRTAEFLAAVMARRAEHIVVRVAEHDLTAAYRVIQEWRAGQLITDQQAGDLWKLVASDAPGAAGYL
ncbi:MAG: hypothetical protein ACRBK7_10760 [Acidimicrobiales bacterium]